LLVKGFSEHCDKLFLQTFDKIGEIWYTDGMQTNSELKKHNIVTIFRALQQHGRLSRKELACITNLSWGSVSAISNELILRDIVVAEKERSAGGRPAEVLTLNPYRFLRLGIDINSGGLTFVIVNLQGKTLYEDSKQLKSRRKEEVLAQIFEETEKLLSSTPEVLDISLSMQGKIHRETGVSVRANFSEDWANVPLVALFEERFHLPTFLYHDPDCLLYYHLSSDGRLHGKRDGFVVRLDNGIGMARLLQGKLYTATDDGGYEFGQMIAVRDGKDFLGGKRGCLEAYASIRGMKEVYEAETGGDFIQNLSENEPRAQRVLQEGMKYLGLAIANLFILSSPEFILLDGALLTLAPRCFADIKKFVQAYAEEEYPLLCAHYKKEAPAVGACLLTLEKNTEALLFPL